MPEVPEKVIKVVNKYAGLVEKHIDFAIESESGADAEKVKGEMALLRQMYAEAIAISKMKLPRVKYQMVMTKKESIVFWSIYIATLIISVSALIICCMHLL